MLCDTAQMHDTKQQMYAALACLQSAICSVQIDLTPIVSKLHHAAALSDATTALHKAAGDTRRQVALASLALRDCTTLNNESVSALLDNVPTLHSLDFARCSAVQDGALRRIARHEVATDAVIATQAALQDMSIGQAQARFTCCLVFNLLLDVHIL